MNPIEKSSINALLNAVKSSRNQETDTEPVLTVQDFVNKLLTEPDKKIRKKMIKQFSESRADVARFLADNEDLINAEAEMALIGAAVGSMHTEKEVSYKGGRRNVTTKNKKVLPNVNALSLLLKNRMPDKYSDKPQTEIEIEDLLDIEKELYGNEKDTT